MAVHRCQLAPRTAPVRALVDCAVRIVGYPPDRRIERLRICLVDYDLIEAIARVIKAQKTRPRLGSVSSAVDLTIVCAQIEAVRIRWIDSQGAGIAAKRPNKRPRIGRFPLALGKTDCGQRQHDNQRTYCFQHSNLDSLPRFLTTKFTKITKIF